MYSLLSSVLSDPYMWVEAMQRRSLHCPNHFKLGWEKFVTTPWTMNRTANDEALLEGNKDPREVQCTLGYYYNQVNSCLHHPFAAKHVRVGPSGLTPQYEMKNDGSGKPYASILDLRADKIRNHLSVASWDWVTEFISVRYEDLLSAGTGDLIRQIESASGIQAQCETCPPQNRAKRKLKSKMVKYLTEHLDWEAESLAGYERQAVASQ